MVVHRHTYYQFQEDSGDTLFFCVAGPTLPTTRGGLQLLPASTSTSITDDCVKHY